MPSKNEAQGPVPRAIDNESQRSTISSPHRSSRDPMSLASIVHETDIPIIGDYKEAGSLAATSDTNDEILGSPVGIKRSRKEQKRQWRKNLTPDQRKHRREVDAERKRLKRNSRTELQLIEQRKKDAYRKATKRRMHKIQENIATMQLELGRINSHELPPAESMSGAGK